MSKWPTAKWLSLLILAVAMVFVGLVWHQNPPEIVVQVLENTDRTSGVPGDGGNIVIRISPDGSISFSDGGDYQSDSYIEGASIEVQNDNVCHVHGPFYVFTGDIWDITRSFGNAWKLDEPEWLIDSRYGDNVWTASGYSYGGKMVRLLVQEDVLYVEGLSFIGTETCTSEKIVVADPWVYMSNLHGGEWSHYSKDWLVDYTMDNGAQFASGINESGQEIIALIYEDHFIWFEYQEVPSMPPGTNTNA